MKLHCRKISIKIKISSCWHCNLVCDMHVKFNKNIMSFKFYIGIIFYKHSHLLFLKIFILYLNNFKKLTKNKEKCVNLQKTIFNCINFDFFFQQK